jgi:hypothetical protein
MQQLTFKDWLRQKQDSSLRNPENFRSEKGLHHRVLHQLGKV